MNTAGSFTIAQIYQLLKDASAGPGDFAEVAPTLRVFVQDSYASQTTTSAGSSGGGPFDYFAADLYLKGVSSTFASYPAMQMTHEYGHVWTQRHRYLDHNGDWAAYVGTRWSSADGSVLLGQDSRLGSSYTWSVAELAADDYRLLFGTTAALTGGYINSSVVDPRQQSGLRNWFLSSWK